MLINRVLHQCLFGMLSAFLVAGGCSGPDQSTSATGGGPSAIQDQPFKGVGTSNNTNVPKDGAGALEFHILVDSVDADAMDPTQLKQMRHRLEAAGPKDAGDAAGTMRWYEVERGHEKSIYGIADKYNGKEYVLAWITPGKSLDHRPGTPPWGLRDAGAVSDQIGEQVVQFTFDPEGGKLFGELTGNNLKKPLAIILDNKILTAPTIQSMIHETGIIDGGAEGFTPEELGHIINTLNAGIGAPAPSAPVPPAPATAATSSR